MKSGRNETHEGLQDPQFQPALQELLEVAMAANRGIGRVWKHAGHVRAVFQALCKHGW